MLQDVALFAIGIIVGGMNSVAGGGMLLGFPVLLAIGLPALIANATSNIVVLPGQIASAVAYRKSIAKVPRSYLLLLIPCIVGGTFGALWLRHTSLSNFTQIVPILIVFAVVLFILQPYLHFHFRQHINTPSTKHKPPLWLAFALIPLTVYGGYFGAGLGFAMLAFLSFTDLKDIHVMNGLKNITAAVICVISIACLYSANLIDWHHGLVMGGGNLLGGYYGARLSQHVSSQRIRYVVIAIGVVTAGYLVLKAY